VYAYLAAFTFSALAVLGVGWRGRSCRHDPILRAKAGDDT
jgi:hypothetical protein